MLMPEVGDRILDLKENRYGTVQATGTWPAWRGQPGPHVEVKFDPRPPGASDAHVTGIVYMRDTWWERQIDGTIIMEGEEDELLGRERRGFGDADPKAG